MLALLNSYLRSEQIINHQSTAVGLYFGIILSFRYIYYAYFSVLYCNPQRILRVLCV